jgi:hypothetical protein
LNAGDIVSSSTGRNNSASIGEVAPTASADVSNTFGAATANSRVAVATDRPADDRIARRTYLPGGS